MANVRVRVPATSANLGPGFDAFGLALGLYDEVSVSVADSGLQIDIVGEGAGEVPTGEDHLVVRAMRATFDQFGEGPDGLRLHCTNAIPHGRGLGSSAAAIVAGVLAARALVEEGEARLDTDSCLALAASLEGHPDNVAACLLGGLTVAWIDGGVQSRAWRLEPVEVSAVAFVPSAPVSTQAARGLLPATIPHADAAANAGRAGLLVAALAGTPGAEANLELLLAATEDRLHQPYRAPAMPESLALVRELRERGIPAVISGAGPTVLAFCQEADSPKVVAEAPVGFVARCLGIDRPGALVQRGTANGE
jgi:homoserine kinase